MSAQFPDWFSQIPKFRYSIAQLPFSHTTRRNGQDLVRISLGFEYRIETVVLLPFGGIPRLKEKEEGAVKEEGAEPPALPLLDCEWTGDGAGNLVNLAAATTD